MLFSFENLQLSSIPELTHNIPHTPEVAETPAIAEQTNALPIEETNGEPEQSEDKTDSLARPEYDRFIKMVQVGVPVQAVKLKVSLEGLDPNVLEDILRK